jgi:hypothetical protein
MAIAMTVGATKKMPSPLYPRRGRRSFKQVVTRIRPPDKRVALPEVLPDAPEEHLITFLLESGLLSRNLKCPSQKKV